jgi:hypothetical protein
MGRAGRQHRREQRWAELRFEPRIRTVLFVRMQGARGGAHVIYEVRLESFEEMELSTLWIGLVAADLEKCRGVAPHLGPRRTARAAPNDSG